MPSLSSNYLTRVESWINGGTPLQQMHMSIAQKVRAQLCYEAYMIWLQNKQISPRELLTNIARRDYPQWLLMARDGMEGHEFYRDIVNELKITDGTQRTISEIANDVYLLNWLIGQLDTSVEHIEKAKVIDASDTLIREGKKMGDMRAIGKGADLKMNLFHNFDGKNPAEEEMPPTQINITGDVSIIKSDCVNYTEEEKKKLQRKYGLSGKDVKELFEMEDGTFAPLPGAEDAGIEKEEEKDIFEEAENK